MIHYLVRCDKGHEFEGWFRDSAAFDGQVRRRLVTCPSCGSHRVGKAPMAPAVSGSRPSSGLPQAAAELRRTLDAVRARIEANCDYVGDRFAEEARRIHYREVKPRGIYGEASDRQARELADEGVPFSRMPWPRRADS